ncbi:MAG: hypothetical protein F4124_15735 [Acidimicrobiia bacterium]|nr:hypothetical protein [bacterium]MYB73561.1 hypothetical protein [Acidimicrobiia bacterium]MYE72638.1 hypothetical protein [Acidimicrobiia bacterium]MYG72179.1 hypothetical protein [Acidimicrobiia bacterium]MYI00871.1 hypothetical protein [Acidimicrobiia bacterium]
MTMKATTRLYELLVAAAAISEDRVRQAWQTERGDVTSTVIVIAVLVAAAVAAGVVITTFITGQTSKIS